MTLGGVFPRISFEELRGEFVLAKYAYAGRVQPEVCLPDLHTQLQGGDDLGFDLVVPGALEDLETGILVEEADQQDRALVCGEAASQLADVFDESIGRGQRGLRPGLDVVADGDLQVLQRGLD